MKFKTPSVPIFARKPSFFYPKYLMASPLSENLNPHSDPPQAVDEVLCSDRLQEQHSNRDPCFFSESTKTSSFFLGSPGKYLGGESHIERAWAHWTRLGRPKLIVAPMVDNSELPFRMLCRKYGAQAAYTPMLHSRIFTETEKYRNQEFTTCTVI